jgi:hypothetical protein
MWFKLATAVGALIVLAVALLLVVTYQPAWYQPAGIDYRTLRADRHRLISVVDQVGDALNHGKPIEITLDEALLNRWLAERRELPEGYQFDLGPLRRPFVDLRPDGSVRLAALVAWGGAEMVCSVDATVAITTDRVELVLKRAHLGALPVPVSVVSDIAERFESVPRQSLAWRNDFVWPNGRVSFAIQAVRVTDTDISVSLIP